MLSIAVLGPVEVRRDGALVSLPSGKPTEVLVRLAVDVGTPVRADRLIDDLWAEDAARTGKNTLQSKVSQLRRALGRPMVRQRRAGRGGHHPRPGAATMAGLRPRRAGQHRLRARLVRPA
jgi:DNA-binding SARP family transcriptional activator